MRTLPIASVPLAAVTLFAILMSPAVAQQGPPPEVRQAISALTAFIDSDGDAALDDFMNTALDAEWLAEVSPAKARATLQEIRSAARGAGGNLDVSRTPDGLVLELSGSGQSARVGLAVTPAGISELQLLEAPSAASGTRRVALNDHLMALERLGSRSLDEALAEFEDLRFSGQFMAETTRDERRALLESIREVAASAGAVMLGAEGDLMRLKMRGPSSLSVLVGVAPEAPYKIDLLRTEAVDAGEQKIELGWDNLEAVFDEQAANGFSGVVHIRRADEVLLHRAYGPANRSLGIDNRIDTVFGIGSTPIDFTVAGILLLAQQGKVDLDDSVTRHFPNVPVDKRGMTLRHLISGQSGLPDFHDIASDWDADLAWVDRQTAVQRILSQPLLFLPGEGRAHSHSAYGLVSAIIEQVSGLGYFQFMKANFFEPAGMTRTGMYGSAGGLALQDFAEGYGNSSVGLPNIPPNWGPTSWLVMGSGGMYSTLDDMLKFYRLVREGGVLETANSARFQGATVGVGGSDRGFYFLHVHKGNTGEIIMMMNGEGRSEKVRALSRALEDLLLRDDST